MKTTLETTSVQIPMGPIRLEGDLRLPARAQGVVVFAHGSGSSRFSPRNGYVAQVLQRAGFATLLLDLLTQAEEQLDERTAQLRFDIQLLASRVIGATDWLRQQPALAKLPVGYFGASTGAGAALMAAPERPEAVRAIVSRGGRPDLAHEALTRVRAPTLLIVGELDDVVIGLNQDALERLKSCEKKLEIVPGATHLFEEPGTLERVAELAADWFRRYLTVRKET